MKKNTERYAKLKEQRKQAAGKQWKNPEIRNEMSKKISIKAIERCNTPEFRKKLSEQSKKQWAASKRRKTAIKRTKLCIEMFLSGKHSIKDICEEAGVSISSFYKYKNNNFIVK
jgi:hypothetical protein